MRKIFVLVFLFIAIISNAQYPNNQSMGNDSALVTIKAATKSRLVNWSFTDTTAANLQRIKSYPGAQIFTTSDSNMWYRTPNANKWVQFFTNTATTTGDTLIWRVGGNALIPMQQQGIYTGLGSKDSTPLFFITNYQRRLVIPPNGVNRSAGTANKCLVIDTVTKFMYYTDCGSGGGTTYTFTNGLTESGGTVKLGGTLTGNTTISNASGHEFKLYLDEDDEDVGLLGINYNGIIGFKNGQTIVSPGTGGILMNAGYMYLESITSGKISSQTIYGDSIVVRPFRGQYYIDTINYTLSTIGKKIMLRDTATGLVQNIDASLLTGATPTLQQVLTAGSTLNTTNTIEIGANSLIFERSGVEALTLGTALTSISSPDGTKALTIPSSGTNWNMSGLTNLSTQTRLVGTFSGNDLGYVTIGSGLSLGTGAITNNLSTGIAGGQTMYGGTAANEDLTIQGTLNATKTTSYVNLQPSGGSVGIGTSTPAKIFHTVGTVRHASLGTASGDTTTYKPLGISSAGDVLPMTYWPGGGGDLTPYTRQQDTITLASFGAGARFQADTAAFTDSTLYGAFYNDGSDTLIVTKIWAVMSGGTSDTLGVQLYYNDSLNVIGSAIATSTLPVNSTTTGNSTSTLTNQKIPPGNWVWCKSPTVIAGRKPYFLSVSMIGYKSRRL